MSIAVIMHCSRIVIMMSITIVMSSTLYGWFCAIMSMSIIHIMAVAIIGVRCFNSRLWHNSVSMGSYSIMSMPISHMRIIARCKHTNYANNHKN